MAPAGCFFARAPGLQPGSPAGCHIHGPGGLFFARTPGLQPGSPAGCRIHGLRLAVFLRGRPASSRADLRRRISRYSLGRPLPCLAGHRLTLPASDHVREDLGRIPTVQDWLGKIQPESRMLGRGQDRGELA
jgi:hypothetical protein